MSQIRAPFARHLALPSPSSILTSSWIGRGQVHPASVKTAFGTASLTDITAPRCPAIRIMAMGRKISRKRNLKADPRAAPLERHQIWNGGPN